MDGEPRHRRLFAATLVDVRGALFWFLAAGSGQRWRGGLCIGSSLRLSALRGVERWLRSVPTERFTVDFEHDEHPLGGGLGLRWRPGHPIAGGRPGRVPRAERWYGAFHPEPCLERTGAL